jgi:hypothetical protein
VQAILGAAGYQSDELYDPIWRHVRVPESFLRLVCPMAEAALEQVAGTPAPTCPAFVITNTCAAIGQANLSGAANHMLMLIDLREYLFQVRFCVKSMNGC